MRFMSVREFRVNTGQARKDLARDEEVVLTANGQPFAVVAAIRPETLDRELVAIRRAKARVALERARESAAAAGTAGMSTKQVDQIISEVRKRRPAA